MSQMRKNISIIECFGVFSTVIAFAGIESRFRAARTVLAERRTADAAATLAPAQGETSTTGVARPMSRRSTTERRDSCLPPPGPDWRSDSPRGAIPLDSTLQTGSGVLAAPVCRGIQEAPGRWARKRVCKPAVTPSGQTAGPPYAELVDANGFFASLVLRRVRARDSAASHPEQPDRLSDHSKLGLSAMLEVRSPLTLRSARPVTTAQVGSPEPALLPLETQLAELACRRLRGQTAGERP